MRSLLQEFGRFFASLRLTVVLLADSLILVFAATLDMQNIGVWEIQKRWFHTWVVMRPVSENLSIPIAPGGYFLGWLLFFNLIAAHIYRFQLSWKKSGLWLTHVGLIVLLLSEFFSSVWQQEYQLRFREGETMNFAESPREDELVLIDASDATWDRVVAIPGERLRNAGIYEHADLPFQIRVRAFYPNGRVVPRSQAPNVPTLATRETTPPLVAIPMEKVYQMDTRNFLTGYVELLDRQGQSLGVWLVSSDRPDAQTFTHEGKTWRIALRPARRYMPFSLTLKQVTHEVYPGSTIPKNFSSRVMLRPDATRKDATDDREVLIYMNNPLRHGGLAFYQFQMAAAEKQSVLQVMRNPTWRLPHLACWMMALGMSVHFVLSLLRFNKRRKTPVQPVATPAVLP